MAIVILDQTFIIRMLKRSGIEKHFFHTEKSNLLYFILHSMSEQVFTWLRIDDIRFVSVQYQLKP